LFWWGWRGGGYSYIPLSSLLPHSASVKRRLETFIIFSQGGGSGVLSLDLSEPRCGRRKEEEEIND